MKQQRGLWLVAVSALTGAISGCDGGDSSSSGGGTSSGGSGGATSTTDGGAGGDTSKGGTSTSSGGGGTTTSTCTETPVETVKCTDIEEAAGKWSHYAQDGATTTITTEQGGPSGTYIQAVTQAGFAFHLRFEATSPIDATAAEVLQLGVRALNTSAVGWQIHAPVLVLEDQSGAQRTWTPGSVLLPTDGVTWKLIEAPLAGGVGWTASGDGIDLAHVSAIEIRTDTWDHGFTLSVDALSFKKSGDLCEVSCPADCSGRGKCDPRSLGCACDLGALGADCGVCAEGFVEKRGACALVNDGASSVWPNEISKANSDPWLAVHHDEIQSLEPRLLVLHFVNESDPATATIVQEVIDGFADGSRYHGYLDASATPQLTYQIDKLIDLRDGVNGHPAPPPGYPYENSTFFPRKPGNTSVDYAAFFGKSFAALYGYPDPASPGSYLDLCSLVERGIIHEVWMVASGDVPDAPAAEVLEAKPRYNAAGTRLPGLIERCAGNGCFDQDVPYCSRSVRIGFVNYNRGPGCYMHSEGHGVESTASHQVMPGLTEWFRRFASMDLDSKYGLPFSSLYWLECQSPPCVAYPSPTKMVITSAGTEITVDPHDGVCGNVHFPPNGRLHYDYGNEKEVLSTCAAFGENALGCGSDAAEMVSSATWAAYEAKHGDCGGGFLTWWYQSMPAFGANKTFADGRKMKSVWPYLFY